MRTKLFELVCAGLLWSGGVALADQAAPTKQHDE